MLIFVLCPSGGTAVEIDLPGRNERVRPNFDSWHVLLSLNQQASGLMVQALRRERSKDGFPISSFGVVAESPWPWTG